MKKIILVLVALLLVGLIVVLVQLGNIASRVVEHAINTYGPQLTGTEVSVGKVSIQPYLGTGNLADLKVGNPSGYRAPEAFTLDEIHVSVVPTSLLGDTVRVREVLISKPHFVYESRLVDSNLGRLMKDIKANTGATDKAAAADTAADESPRKYVINRIVVEDGVVQVGVLGQSTTVKLPRIELENLSPEGITAAEATNKILEVVLARVITAATELALNSALDPAGTAKGVTDSALDAADSATKAVGEAVRGIFER